MSQQLATIQKVLDVRPLVGPDGTPSHSIELANVLGWQCVVKKDSFRSGDTAVFLEIGSVADFKKPPFTFMEKMKGRVKTVRFRGEISQGLALPLSDFKDWALPEVLNEGDEVSEALGVVKWEPAEERQSSGTNASRRCSFPTNICPQTDQKRIQSVPKLLEEIKGKRCVMTLKCDGSSSTFVHFNGEYHVCSRNQSTKDTEGNLWWHVSRKHNIEEKVRAYGNIAIQGELLNSNIQKGRMGVKEPTLMVFDIYDCDKRRYLGYEDFIRVCKELELPTVPILDDNFIFDHTIDQLLELAKGKYDSGHEREGIVIKAYDECYSNYLKGRCSFKIINNDYLFLINE